MDQNYPEDELYYQQEDHDDYNDPEEGGQYQLQLEGTIDASQLSSSQNK